MTYLPVNIICMIVLAHILRWFYVFEIKSSSSCASVLYFLSERFMFFFCRWWLWGQFCLQRLHQLLSTNLYVWERVSGNQFALSGWLLLSWRYVRSAFNTVLCFLFFRERWPEGSEFRTCFHRSYPSEWNLHRCLSVSMCLPRNVLHARTRTSPRVQCLVSTYFSYVTHLY